MATYSDKFSSGWATLYLVVTESSQSITNNTTTLSCALKIKKNSSCSSYNNGGASISMTINGSKLYSSSSFDIRSLSVGSTKTLATKTITVTHNSDGTKSVACKASFSSGVGLGSASITSKTFTCTTIPRASTFTLSTTSVNVGGTITANISRKSTSFDHNVSFYTSKRTFKTYTGVDTSQAFKLDSSYWYSDMPDTTSCTAYCKVTTKSGDKTIGSSVTKTFTVKVPSTVVPTAGKLTLTPEPITISGIQYTGILVQNKNKLTAKVGTCTPGTGSDIDSYTFSGSGFSGTAITSTSSSTLVPSYGDELIYKVTVKDKRGRTATSSNTIQCYQYFKPSFKAGSFNAYRVVEQEDGSYISDANGTKLKCEWTPVIASVGGKNTCSVVVTYVCNGETVSTDPITDKNYTVIDLGESDKTYSVTATLTDGFGATVSSTENSEPITVNGSSRIINVAKNGMGLAIGKMSSVDENYNEPNGLFECSWDAKFTGNVFFDNLVDLIYPVGSIYISVNSTNPATLFGGTWSQLQNRFLLGAGSSYTAGATGGAATVTLTTDQMPSHTHTISSSGTHNHTGYSRSVMSGGGNYVTLGTSATDDVSATSYKITSSEGAHTHSPAKTGGGESHNNMPPYLVVYMWKRTA